ncbi:MAG: hypothetical protein B7Z73_06505 [Planctomycetia bacterium 21-64-5]|nr:MAG: hypothetical protein B7Z73_06505 [Planctomycetia bacterium 21-64-5]
MIASTNSAVIYAVWLQKIVDAHVRKTWDEERSDLEAEEDDRFNDLWRDLDECQQDRLWGLSSDLNTLRDRETWVDADWPPMTPKALAHEQAEAFHNKEWDRLLTSLRRPPRFLPRARVDYMRGRAWMEMGHPEIGLLFLDNAARLEPENPTYPMLVLECLKAMSAWEELRQRAEAHLRNDGTQPRLLLRIADALHLYATATATPEFYQRAIEVVDRGLEQLRASDVREALAAVVAAAFATKALCLQRLAKADDALVVFDAAIQEYPESSILLTARGLLKQQLGRNDAIDDFEQAVHLGTPVVWPYMELARNALHHARWQRAISFCRLGIWRSGQPSITAALFDLLAIAQCERGDSMAEVRSAFDMARDLDPLSEEIRSHFDTFNERSMAGAKRDWKISSKAPPTAINDVYDELRVAA